MDPALAALIGAIVGAVVSSVIPWIRESMTEKRRRREKRRDALAEALAELVSVMAIKFSRILTDPLEIARSEVAQARFTLLTTPSEKPVVETMNAAMYAMSGPEKRRRGEAYATFLFVVSDWHQGVLSPREMADEYEALMQPGTSDA
jgi:hypothetical protein